MVTTTDTNTIDTTTTETGTHVEPDGASPIEAYAGFVAGQATAAANAVLVALGDQLGLWKAMAGAGALSSAQLAERTGLHERQLREWLASQAANGFLDYDPAADTFTLSEAGGLVLADEDSPLLLVGAFQGVGALARELPALRRSFETGEGYAWHDRDPELWDVQERFSRPLMRQFLIDVWLASVPGLLDRLEAGIQVADIGCGYGDSTILLAERFPASRFTGFDFHDHSIARARQAALDAGVTNVAFEVAAADEVPGGDDDLVLFVDSLHDMGDPVAAAEHARRRLAPNGLVVSLDPSSADSLGENLANPMAGLMYAVSTFLCTPTAISQHGPASLGAMAGEAALRQVLVDAGFGRVQRVAPDAPMNMVLVARP
ncbi:MAG TPA: methyltransferase domain-containing protein [Acidimicrobiales bacterium]|jgi:SAM-dependent methyltransferase